MKNQRHNFKVDRNIIFKGLDDTDSTIQTFTMFLINASLAASGA